MRLHNSLARDLAPALAFTLTLAGCGEKAPPPAPPDTTAAPDVAPEVVAPPSRLGEVKALFERPLERAAIEGAIALADALAKEDSPEAARAARRIRLAAIAQDFAALAGAPGSTSRLGAGGADKQLALVLGAASDGSDDDQRILLAARAMKRMLGDTATPWPEARELRAIESGDQPEAIALRLTLAAGVAAALGESRGFDTLQAAVGPFVCSGCGDAPSAEITARPAVDRSGLACAAAADAPWCKVLMDLQAADPVATLGPNALTIAALELVSHLGSESAWAGGAMTSLQGGLGPVALPLPVALPEGPSLGRVDLARAVTETAPAIVVAHLGPDAVRIGARPIVAPGGKVVTTATGVALGEAPATAFATLTEALPDAETGAIAGVTDRLQAVREAIAKAPAPEMLPGERGAVLLAVDPGAPSVAVAKVADGLLAGGATGLRVLRPGTPGEVLPMHLRVMPAELEDALVPAWETPMIVVVGAETLEVWAPQGPRDGALVLGPEAAEAIPTALEQGWRKEALARLAVRLPPAQAAVQRIGPAELKALTEGVAMFAAKASAGRVVHVVAGEGVLAGDVLAVVRHLQEVGLEPAPELARVAEIWPGTRCAAPTGCAGAVAVAFSRATVPSARGLTNKPGAKKDEPREPKEPKPEPGPAPSAEFCNQADIKSQMAKKAGSFRFCYERELQLEKDLAGRLVMQFIIGLQGQVKSVRVASSELKNAKVGECIKKEIGKVQFKAPDGGECVVQWPFKFTAN